MSRNIPNKVITYNDKDVPWIANEIKTVIKRNTRVHRKCVLRRRIPEERGHINIRSVQNGTNCKIKKAKNNYLLNLEKNFLLMELDPNHSGQRSSVWSIRKNYYHITPCSRQ